MNEQTNDQESASVSIGSCLRYERTKRGYSIERIAEETHLSVATIKSLEEDNYEGLPSQQVYIRGYIRSYCSVLEIDANALLGEQISPAKKPEAEHDSMTTEHHYRLIRIWGSLVVVSTIALLVFLWWSERSIPLPGKSPVMETQPPAESPMPDPSAEGAGHQDLLDRSLGADGDSGVLRADEQEPPAVQQEESWSFLTIRTYDQCWTRVMDREGKTIISKLLPAGYYRTIQAHAPFKVHLGNANVVDLWFNGEKQDLSPYVSGATGFASFVLDKPAP